LDGFRSEDGTIRQYVFTEKESRGVAAAIIGKDRVQALGISFFLSKTQRPQPPAADPRGQYIACAASPGSMSLGIIGSDDGVNDVKDMLLMDHSITSDTTALYSSGPPDKLEGPAAAAYFTASASLGTKGVSGPAGPQGLKGVTKLCCNTNSLMDTRSLMSRSAPQKMSAKMGRAISAPVRVKQMEIAAGCEIEQQVYDDPFGLDFWQPEPEGLLIVNYCSEEEARAIVEAGKVDVKGSPEGFLQNVPVGNP